MYVVQLSANVKPTEWAIRAACRLGLRFDVQKHSGPHFLGHIAWASLLLMTTMTRWELLRSAGAVAGVESSQAADAKSLVAEQKLLVVKEWTEALVQDLHEERG